MGNPVLYKKILLAKDNDQSRPKILDFKCVWIYVYIEQFWCLIWQILIQPFFYKKKALLGQRPLELPIKAKDVSFSVMAVYELNFMPIFLNVFFCVWQFILEAK